MVIEVDDAGWGDLVGGAVIVMRRVESDERFVGEVPLNSFQGTAFQEKQYLIDVLRVVKEGIIALNVTQDELIKVCTGYILSSVRASLINEGYKVKPAKIIGLTQHYAEEEYIKSLVRLSVGRFNELKAIRSFKGFLGWVLGDLEKREHFVKTGWKSWSRLRKGNN
jgi:hypothetical protein